ncbi:ABC transporter permease [Streptomyces armeniacus]|uniref:Transport permease protein n=1 Tax=Streptomyces armeniacus TaxID=83291 RepID=A0A345XT71_9ACTN|nr:ABC transporter permease [Streptomyces armeniacus]AXK34837.1 ABC transporter permease [Streptomyces armeniacus]
MSTATAGTAPAAGTARTTAAGRLRALGRAELTLLVRNRTALFSALAIPVLLTVTTRGLVEEMDLSGTGLSVGTVLLPGSMGFVLLFAVYSNMVGTYTARREELVLKRLRTGEPGDTEILLGAALPTIVIAVTQCVLLAVGGAILLDLSAPGAPVLLVAGLLLGLALTVAAAAASTIVTRSTEAAQMTPLPLMMVSFVFSEVFVPLDGMPDTVAAVAAWLPMSPVMELLRGGWTGDLGAAEALRALVVAGAWTALALWAVRKRFRWEPRR